MVVVDEFGGVDLELVVWCVGFCHDGVCGVVQGCLVWVVGGVVHVSNTIDVGLGLFLLMVMSIVKWYCWDIGWAWLFGIGFWVGLGLDLG